MPGGTARGQRALLVAIDSGVIIGTVQLILDLPENQPHRADVSKMLVHRRARRQGVPVGDARLTAEVVARELSRSLLVLDTASADAERLYARLGWVRVGVVPDYALLPDGGFCAHDDFLPPPRPRILKGRFSRETPVTQEGGSLARHNRGVHHAAMSRAQCQMLLRAN